MRSKLIALVNDLLNDDNGISSDAYRSLWEVLEATGNKDVAEAMGNTVKAQDNRFYLTEETVEQFNELVS